MKETKFPGIYEERKARRKALYTRNLSPGKSVYGEKLIKVKDVEYREWEPFKSKLAAAILKGLDQIGLKDGNIVLYLGAASGTTSSHVSDIVGNGGFVFALDFAPRVVRDLVFVCEDRKNMAPLLEDANHPENYRDKILHPVDFIFMDIAQKRQADIFLKNVREFLKPGNNCAIAVKSRSIDVTKKPGEVFKKVRAELEKELVVVDARNLKPFEKDHMLFVCKKK